MSNHLHLVLRARPDLVQNWSDEEIALRWKSLFPPRDPATGKPAEPSECDLNMILSNPERVVELRVRLAKPVVVHALPERADRAERIARTTARGVFGRAGSNRKDCSMKRRFWHAASTSISIRSGPAWRRRPSNRSIHRSSTASDHRRQRSASRRRAMSRNSRARLAHDSGI